VFTDNEGKDDGDEEGVEEGKNEGDFDGLRVLKTPFKRG
jgi:hypothetical protein